MPTASKHYLKKIVICKIDKTLITKNLSKNKSQININVNQSILPIFITSVSKLSREIARDFNLLR